MSTRNLIDASHSVNWVSRGEGLSTAEVNLGCMLRIANAAESQAASATLMASNYLQLQNDAERYRKWWLQQEDAGKHAQRQNAALRGVITRQKKEIERLKQLSAALLIEAKNEGAE